MSVNRVLANPDVASPGWRDGLPVLTGRGVTLRELQRADAPALREVVSCPEVARYAWPPPATIDAFERFIDWTHEERQTGRYICFGLVPRGSDQVCGIFELRQLQPQFFRAELGFLIDPRFWGTGLFVEAAQLALDFAFQVVQIHRVEARAAVENARGNAALEKIGARHEGVLEEAFCFDGRYMDQNLWAIVGTRRSRVKAA